MSAFARLSLQQEQRLLQMAAQGGVQLPHMLCNRLHWLGAVLQAEGGAGKAGATSIVQTAEAPQNGGAVWANTQAACLKKLRPQMRDYYHVYHREGMQGCLLNGAAVVERLQAMHEQEVTYHHPSYPPYIPPHVTLPSDWSPHISPPSNLSTRFPRSPTAC